MSQDSLLLKRGLSILLLFEGEENGQSIAGISRKMGLPFSTTSRILRALEEENFLERDQETKLYHLSLNCYRLGSLALEGGLLRRISRPFMEELRRRYNETVIFYIRKGDRRVYYAQLEGAQSLRRTVTVGATAPLWVGSASRCLLAFSPDGELERILADITPLTPRTVTDSAQVIKKIHEIRNTRYDVSDSEREEGVFSISSPILSAPCKVAACLTLTGPTLRFKEDILPSMIADVRDAAEKISAMLQQS